MLVLFALCVRDAKLCLTAASVCFSEQRHSCCCCCCCCCIWLSFFLQAYCHNYGMAWLIDSPCDEDDQDSGRRFKPGSPIRFGPSLCWLLEKAGLQQLQQPMGECRSVLLHRSSTVIVQDKKGGRDRGYHLAWYEPGWISTMLICICQMLLREPSAGAYLCIKNCQKSSKRSCGTYRWAGYVMSR
jgi:hypothetical protein